MAKRIRVGIIGGGAAKNQWASMTLIPALQALSPYEITAVGTTRMESAEESARKYGVPLAFANTTELVQHPDVDMVIVSVKVPGHHDAVMAALQAGKHVYCEWPLGVNLAEAADMERAAAAQHVHHAIGLQGRQSPEVNYVKDLVANGYVGKVLSVHLKVFTVAKGGLTNESATYILDNANGANLLTINAGHAIDTMCYALGDFTEVSATIANQFKQAKVQETGQIIEKTTADQILINGTLHGGATASIHVQGGITHRTGISLEIFGSEGVIVLSNDSLHGQFQWGNLKVEGARLTTAEHALSLSELSVPAPYRWVPEAIPDGPILNFAQALAKFATDIHSGNHIVPGFAEALKLHRLLALIQKAADTGQRQMI